MAFHVPENCRVTFGLLASKSIDGNNGLFEFIKDRILYRCIASDGLGWEHVSVSLSVKRCPDWEEMCMIKDMFWDEGDTVVQFHPKKSEYINYHPNVLHLWKKVGEQYELPPSICVGPK